MAIPVLRTAEISPSGRSIVGFYFQDFGIFSVGFPAIYCRSNSSSQIDVYGVMTMANKSLLKLVAWSLVICTSGTLTASAHHASTNYDIGKQYVFSGVVRKFLWQNPHTWLFVMVQKADGTSEAWGFEANGPNVLARNGWHATDLNVGDKVTVYASPERDGRHNALMAKVMLPDGRVLLGSPDIEKAQEATGAPGNNLPALPKVTPVEYK